MSNNTIDNNLLIVLNRTLNRSRARGLVASSLWAAELLYELDNGGDFNYKKDSCAEIPSRREEYAASLIIMREYGRANKLLEMNGRNLSNAEKFMCLYSSLIDFERSESEDNPNQELDSELSQSATNFFLNIRKSIVSYGEETVMNDAYLLALWSMIEQRLGNFERALENALFAYRLEPCLLIAWDQLLSAFSFILNENMDRKQCLNLCESDDYVEFVPDHANTKVFKGTLSIVKNIHYLNLKARLGSIVDDACTCKSNGKLCDIKFRIQCHSFSEFRSSYQNDLCDSLAKPSYEFKIPMDSFEDFSVTTKRLKTEIKHKFDGIDRKEDIFITCSNQNPMLKNSTCDEESILGTEIQVNPSNKSNYQIKYPTGFFQDGQKIHSHSYSTIYNDVFSNESTYEILQRAIILYNNRNNNEALIRLEVLQKRDPYRMYECLEYLSDIYFMSGRQDDLAALSRLSKSISKFHRTTCYVTGNYFSLCGDSAKAAIQFKRAVRLDQNFSTAWILLAHQFIELRLPLPAINSYRKAAKVAPFDFRTWYGLAQIYEALGKIGLAIEYYERASYTSNDFKVFMSLGRCLFQHGRYRSAINAYHKATQYVIKHDSEKMEPDDHLNIAQAYTNLHPKNSEERIDFKELSFKHNCSYLRMLLPNPNLNVENDLTVNSENQVLATDYYSVPNNSTSCESKNEKIRQDSLIENIINDQCLRADFLEFVSQILRTGDNLSAIWRIAVMELLTVIEANDLSHISTKATHLKKLI